MHACIRLPRLYLCIAMLGLGTACDEQQPSFEDALFESIPSSGNDPIDNEDISAEPSPETPETASATSEDEWHADSADLSTEETVEPATSPVEEYTSNGTFPLHETFQGDEQSEYLPVDIVFLVDTSGSMDDEKRSLEMTMAMFLDALAINNSVIDAQVFLIGKDFRFPDDLSEMQFAAIDEEVHSWNALGQLKAFLQGDFDSDRESALMLRESARKEIVVITDDNAKRRVRVGNEINAEEFLAFYESSANSIGELHMNAIMGLEESVPSKTCSVEEIGFEYRKIIEMEMFSGLQLDVCAPDWELLLTELVDAIISIQPKSRFELAMRLDPTKEYEVRVNGEPVSKDMIQLAPSGDAILFHPMFAPNPGDTIDVFYFPEDN